MATTEIAMTEVTSTKSLFLPTPREEPEINSINFRQSLKFFQEQLVLSGNTPSPNARLNNERNVKYGIHSNAQNNRESAEINKFELFNEEISSLNNCKIQIPTVDTILESVRVLRAIQKSQKGRSAQWTLDTTSESGSDQQNQIIDSINALNNIENGYSIQEQMVTENGTPSLIADENEPQNGGENNGKINGHVEEPFDSDQTKISFSCSANKACSFWPSNTINRDNVVEIQNEEKSEICTDIKLIEDNSELQNGYSQSGFQLETITNNFNDIAIEQRDKFPIFVDTEFDTKREALDSCFTQEHRYSKNSFESPLIEESNSLKNANHSFSIHNLSEENLKAQYIIAYVTEPNSPNPNCTDIQNCHSVSIPKVLLSNCSTDEHRMKKLESIDGDSGIGTQRSISSSSPTTQSRMRKDSWSDTCSSLYVSAECSPCPSLTSLFDSSFGFHSYLPTPVTDSLDEEYNGDSSENIWEEDLPVFNEETKDQIKDPTNAPYSITWSNSESCEKIEQDYDVNIGNVESLCNALEILNLQEQDAHNTVFNKYKNNDMKISNDHHDKSDPTIIYDNDQWIPNATEKETLNDGLIHSAEIHSLSAGGKELCEETLEISKSGKDFPNSVQVRRDESEHFEIPNANHERERCLDSDDSQIHTENLLPSAYHVELESDILDSENLENSFTSFTSIDLISSSPQSQNLEEKNEPNSKYEIEGKSLDTLINGEDSVRQNLNGINEENIIQNLEPLSEKVMNKVRVDATEVEIVRHKKIMTSSWNLVSIMESLYEKHASPTDKVPSQSMTFGEDVFILSQGAFSSFPEGLYHIAIQNSLLTITPLQESQSVLSFPMMYGNVKIVERNILMIDNKMGRCLYLKCDTMEDMKKLKYEIELQCHYHWQTEYLEIVQYPLKCHKNVVIIDLGSCSTRAGILMDQPSLPQLLFPTICATDKINGNCVYGMEALQPEVRRNSILSFPVRPTAKVYKNVIDVDLLGGLFQKIFTDLLIDPAEYTVQVCLPRNVSINDRQALVKLLLEDLKVEAVTLTTEAILTMYAHHIDTAVIVDIGDRMDIIPVVDGFIVENGVTRLPYGGQRIIHHMKHALAEKHISLSSDIDSYVVQYIVENLAYVAEDFDFETCTAAKCPNTVKMSLTLQPFTQDDTLMREVTLEDARFKIPEGLFKPELWGLDNPGVHQLVQKAIQATSVDARKKVAENIYVSGGVTMLPGFVERLNTEVAKLSKTKVLPKVHASNYRYHSTFIGACNFARMKEFQQVCLNLKDFKGESDSLKKFVLFF